MITKCTHSKCEKSNQCKRFLGHKNGTEIAFKNICNKENNYEWFWKTDTNLANKTQ